MAAKNGHPLQTPGTLLPATPAPVPARTSTWLKLENAPRRRCFPKNYNNECLNQLSRTNFAFATTFHVNMEVALYKVEEWEPSADWIDWVGGQGGVSTALLVNEVVAVGGEAGGWQE